ncbi:MAG TPA: hypothetical protein VF752_09975, partial [Thermoleophilaceae bacterium]
VTGSSRGSYAADAKASRRALPFYFKPTGLGTYLLYDSTAGLVSIASTQQVVRADAPAPAAEWRTQRRARGLVALRSTSSGRLLAVDRASRALVTVSRNAPAASFRLTPARGCRSYPEAALGARGKPPAAKRADGSLIGFADPHLHVTAEFRAGGQVISGQTFDRFGITEALGHDADAHGNDGALDITGNLLRSGQPAGTHDTHGWPTFAGWPTFDTYTHQQVYYRWLQRAWMGGLRLIVAQTVEDEPLCNIEPRKSHSCDETETIELEVRRLRALQNYVDAQSGGRGRGWFRLVYSPRQARQVILRGKLAVIIGVESSNPFGCSEFMGQPHCDRAGIDRGIARMRRIGVRSMFLAHWVDNALAGAALEGGDKGTFIGTMQVAQTGRPFATGPCPHPGQGEEVPATSVLGELLPVHPAARQCNTRGLTELGAYAVRQLMDNHMLIEVDHLSEWARDQVLKIAEERRYPVVSSHTGTGGSWDPSELRRLYAVGGFASATIDDAAKLPDKILTFRRYTSAKEPAVGFATDTGGFAALPGPDPRGKQDPLRYPFRAYGSHVRFERQRTGSRTFDINTDGVAHYGLVPDLLANVQREKNGRRALALLFHSADAYLRTWRLAAGK